MNKKLIISILMLVSIYKNLSANPGLRDRLSNIVHGRHRSYYYDDYGYRPRYVASPEEDVIKRQADLEKREAEYKKQEKLAKLRQEETRKQLEFEKKQLYR